jgi:hypothetical protein
MESTSGRPLTTSQYLYFRREPPPQPLPGAMTPKSVPNAQSQTEIFRRTISSTEGSSSPIWYLVIHVPNNILINNESSFYVADSHRYPEGATKLVED